MNSDDSLHTNSRSGRSINAVAGTRISAAYGIITYRCGACRRIFNTVETMRIERTGIGSGYRSYDIILGVCGAHACNVNSVRIGTAGGIGNSH